MQTLPNTQAESETNSEGAVALLVVFLLVIVFVAQSGLLSGAGPRDEMARPQVVEASQVAGS